MLHMNDVTKTIRTFTLGPVNLEIEPGYVYAVVGPNGSGKSVLFRLMMGLLHPDTGNVVRFGAPLDSDDMQQACRIAYVPEALTGHDEWSISELRDLHQRFYPTFDRVQSKDLLRGIEPGSKFRSLSKGMQRRTMLGLALSTNADLLLLDEPTDGVDPFARRDILAELSGYLESGDRSLVIATHNLDDVRRIADYIVVLNAGQHVGTFTRDELLDGWQRFWLSREPSATLPGEVSRTVTDGIQLISRDPHATRAALLATDIQIIQAAPVDAVESVELAMSALSVQSRDGP